MLICIISQIQWYKGWKSSNEPTHGFIPFNVFAKVGHFRNLDDIHLCET